MLKYILLLTCLFGYSYADDSCYGPIWEADKMEIYARIAKIENRLYHIEKTLENECCSDKIDIKVDVAEIRMQLFGGDVANRLYATE